MKIPSITSNGRISLPRIKPLYFDLEQVCMDDMIQAYFSCVKRKGNKNATKTFERELWGNLERLMAEINEGIYIISPSKGFVVTEPKIREIWAANYRDRIVHHLIYNKIAWWYEKRFIRDSYSCIKGRGVLDGCLRVSKFIRSITNNWDPKHKNNSYYLKLDIGNYFMSLNLDNLCKIALRDFQPNAIIGKLFEQVIRNDFRIGAELIDKEKFKLVPSHKSAFNIPYGTGIAIGNLTSQFLSNFYLNELDQYIKKDLKVKYYGRYVDDLIVLSNNLEELKHIHSKIKIFLKEKLLLDLAESKTVYGDIYQGVDFAGFLIKPFRTYMRKDTIKRFLIKIKTFLDYPKISVKRAYKFRATVNSYLGLMRHSSSYNLRKKICKLIEANSIFTADKDYLKIFIDKDKVAKIVFSNAVMEKSPKGRRVNFDILEFKNKFFHTDEFKTIKEVESDKEEKKKVTSWDCYLKHVYKFFKRIEDNKKLDKEISESCMKIVNEHIEKLYGGPVKFPLGDHPRAPPILEKYLNDEHLDPD